MLIACLGWGSLVWDPRELPVRGDWFADGPFLPIEFARQSSNGRMTLVIVPNGFPLVRSLWKPMDASNLKEARTALGVRECSGNPKPESCVDYWQRDRKNRLSRKFIDKWAKALQIDVVVWTALPPKFNDENGRIPTAAEVVTYSSAIIVSVL